MPARYQIGQEADVEGQGLRFKDGEGNEWAIASDRVKSITVRDVSGEEHEVEGHYYRKLEPEPDVEGQGLRMRRDDGSEIQVEEPFRVKFTDDDGQEQEVEGHRWHASDLRIKREVAPLRDALARLRQVALESR